MKVITKYKAYDGVEFTDEKLCHEHERNCDTASNIMVSLPENPDSCDFSNGSGYLQHEAGLLLSVRNEFLEFTKRYTDHKWIQETIDKGFDAHASYESRILGEVLPNSIHKHWYRFSCIDSECREWGQPCYANNPQDGDNLRLNNG